MAELVASVAIDTAGSLATEYASPYVSSFFHFGKIIEDFKNQRHQLELKKDRVTNDVDEARKQTEIIEKDVEDWLRRAEKELGEAQTLEDEVEHSKCFKWCPNWGWRCCLSKKVAEKTRLIYKLYLESSNFPRVSHPAPLKGLEFLISKDLMRSKSSNEAFDRIMKALTSDDVNMIGLHGMPGVGKTTLAIEVGKQARERKLFNTVVTVTVSQNPDFNKIQEEIGNRLGLKFKKEEDSEKTKAEKLWRRLMEETRLLIIFDDIWKCYSANEDDIWDQLKMKAIGIPCGDEHRGCKILLTTRSEQVCRQMDCQERIRLNLLSEDEAWTLFKDNARLENPSPPLIDVAQEVARECQGLPLAIITVARALKGETLTQWELVNQRLKESRHLENQEVCGGIYRSLKISYDYLKENNYQLCLQLCSLFPEDYEITIKELTVYGIGQGMFDNVNSIEEARREMSVTTTKLQECGLLLKIGDVNTVKMHDVVRDFVHWMTLKGENDQNMLYVRTGLKKWPRQSLGCYTAISLINSEINDFPDRLEFPKLEVFLLDIKSDTRVPSMFFQGMKALKVLFLQCAILSLEGLHLLPNLRILRLKFRDLENASWLGNLKKLEVLVIEGFNFKELWCELTGLTTLRLLAISCNNRFKVFAVPKYWLSSFVELEELYLNLDVEWAISEESANKVSLSEFSSLPRLTHLSMQVCPECIPKQFAFPLLQSYDIAVNDADNSRRIFPWYENQRCLEIRKFSLNAFKEFFCNVEDLELGHILDLEYLIDTTKEQGSKSAFTNLVRLTLDNMICSKGLCHGLPPVGFLRKLETLTIKYCPKLVLEDATVQNLKELTVEECEQMQVIFQTDGVLLHANQEIHQMPLESSLTQLHLESLSELTSIWKEPTDHVSLRNLTRVNISSCDKLTSVFSLSLAQTLLHLEDLKISHCNGLEQVFDNMAEETNNGQVIQLPQLQSLELEDLQNLSSICPKNYFVISPSLNDFRVLNCSKLTQSKDFPCAYKDMMSCLKNLTLDGTSMFRNLIPDVDPDPEVLNGLVFLKLHNCSNVECLYETVDHRQPTIAFSYLVELVIEEMIGLKKLCNNRPQKGFMQKLEKLIITNCMNLASLSPVGQNLKEVRIESCGQLQEIFQVDEVLHNLETNQAPLISSLTSLKLHKLSELRCIWKGSTHHVSLRNLKVVRISSCNKLMSVFSLSLAQTLLHLEDLNISRCNGLEQVFDNMAEETNNGQVIQLPQLQSLELDDLQNLSSICLKNYFLISPSLNDFRVLNCPKLTQSKDFPCAYKDMMSCLKNLTLDGTSMLRNLIPDVDLEGLNQLVFLKLHNCSNVECLYEATEHRQLTIAFSNLVRLVIEEMIGLKKLCNNRPSKGFLQKLEKLKITNCMNLASLSPVGQNLKEVTIESCGQLQEIFQVDEVLHNLETNQAPILLSNLKTLHLHQLSKLRHIWKGPSHSVINLQSLEIVTISNCNRLRCLFSPSLVKSLVQLERLILHDLPELEQLITELESDAEQEQQVLNKVEEKVDEQHKPCLPLMLPSLKYFEVSRCPRLTPFVIQQEVNNQAQVKGLYLSNRQCSSFDILLRQSLPNLEHGIVGSHLQFLQQLIMSNCSKLKYLFSPMLAQSLPRSSFLQIIDEDKTSASSSRGHLQPICLSSLNEIHIEECNNLKCLFPASVALSLPKLQKFTVRGASELKQVFEYQGGTGIEDIEKDKTSASSSQGHLQPICFSSLEEIHIEECNNLKCLFSVSVALSLPELWKFTIRGASELEQVFGYQGGTGFEDIEKELVLPRLSRLSLKVLPRLKSFIPMGYHCSFPSLYSLNVKQCPNLTTSFRTYSTNSTYPRIKAAGDLPTEGSATDVDVTEVSDTNGEIATPIGSDIKWDYLDRWR